ncbi:hypothetical protein LguiA_033471 [Lonicera macranthoides]
MVHLEMCIDQRWTILRTLLSGDLHGQFKRGFKVDYGIGPSEARWTGVSVRWNQGELFWGSVLCVSMADRDLEAMMSAVSLTEEECEVTVVGADLLGKYRELEALVLVGKVVIDKQVNKEGLRAALRKAWGRVFSLSEVGFNIFSFSFEKSEDVEWVLRRGPWNFDHSLVAFQRIDGSLQPSALRFSHEKFWVRLYNLSFLCRSREIASVIGGKIGQVDDVDVGPNGDGLGKFIRVRVTVDILKPLKRGVTVSLTLDKPPVWVPVSYERLPDFCFECGCIGHGYKDCTKFINLNPEERAGKRPYGVWLRGGGSSLKEKMSSREGDRPVSSSHSSATRSSENEEGKTPLRSNQQDEFLGLVDVPIVTKDLHGAHKLRTDEFVLQGVNVRPLGGENRMAACESDVGSMVMESFNAGKSVGSRPGVRKKNVRVRSSSLKVGTASRRLGRSGDSVLVERGVAVGTKRMGDILEDSADPKRLRGTKGDACTLRPLLSVFLLYNPGGPLSRIG